MRHLLTTITLLISLSGCYINLELPISRDQPLEERVLGGSGETKIALIELSGMMASNWISNVGSRRSSIDVDEVREQLVMAAGDPAVRAVLLHINSPGGEVTTADVLFHELKQFRQRSGKCVNLILRHNHWQQIRIGKISVIMRIFFAAHGSCCTSAGVK